MEGSTQGSWNDTKEGENVTITCQDNHVLDGNSELTCTIDGSWSSNAPKCKGIFGKFEIRVSICEAAPALVLVLARRERDKEQG